MSSICGIVKRNKSLLVSEDVKKMLGFLNHWEADKINMAIRQPAGFGHLMLYTTPESKKEQLPYFDQQAKIVITADARIDNRNEIINKLDLDNSITDSQLILELYKKFNK